MNEIIITEGIEPNHSKQEAKQMEVHHHPQPGKKSFKEYLLEGLMIFVAVTLGFISENYKGTH